MESMCYSIKACPAVGHLSLISIMKKNTEKELKKKDWFRLKQYPHIGLPHSTSDRKWIEDYVKDKSKIEKHAFFPFIHRKLNVRRFRKEIFLDGTRSKLRKPSSKPREIYYSNHLDSNIYSYYAQKLSKEYENRLSDYGLDECITGYRRIKVEPINSEVRNKCNIDFANDIFSYIKCSGINELVAITFDIKSFFDNLNHKKLKKYWRLVINSGLDLPRDHYNVFRNITKFSYVEEHELFSEFKSKILVKREPDIIKKIEVSKICYMRNKRAIAFCKNENIEILRQKKLIKANKYIYDKITKEKTGIRDSGIPQGSPLSSVLANIYLIDFDKSVNNLLTNIGGIYRRYSDDMVAICKLEHEKDVIGFFLNTINEYCLEMQESKTKVFHFKFDVNKNRYYSYEKNLKTNKLQDNTNFEYLGFQFDGHCTLLKSSSIARFYRKMKQNISIGKFHSLHNRTKTKGELFKSRLYKKFTYRGSSRRRIYIRDKKQSDRFILSHKYDWGNFLTYAKLAASIIPENKITGQIKRHWGIFHKLIKDAVQK